MHLDSGLEIRGLLFVISGLGDLQHGWGCLCSILIFLAPVWVLLVWVSIVCRVPGVFRPLSCCSAVLFCDKWLLLACVVVLVVLVVSVLSETPTEGPFPSLFFLLALVAVGPSRFVVLLSAGAASAQLVVLLCSGLAIAWFSPLLPCCALLLCVFLLVGGAWGVLPALLRSA